MTFPDRTLSFLGLVANAGEHIARVKITTGTAALGPNDNPAQGVDMVVMDDFIHAEPHQPYPSRLRPRYSDSGSLVSPQRGGAR